MLEQSGPIRTPSAELPQAPSLVAKTSLLALINGAKPTANRAWCLVVQGTANRDEVRGLVQRLLSLLLWREEFVLPRVLRAAPSLPDRVAISSVVSRSYGGGKPEKSHSSLVKELFLELSGAHFLNAEVVIRPQCSSFPKLTWISLLASLVVDRTLGSVAGAAIAEALRNHYGISDRGTAYFRDLEAHGPTDKLICLDLISDAVVDAKSLAEVESCVADALLTPPEDWFACSLDANSKSFVLQSVHHKPRG